jgi:hypothetical protein
MDEKRKKMRRTKRLEDVGVLAGGNGTVGVPCVRKKNETLKGAGWPGRLA